MTDKHEVTVYDRVPATASQADVRPTGPLMRCGLRRRLDTPESRAFWAHVDRNVAEVATWPAWKRGLGEFTRSERSAVLAEIAKEEA